MCLTFDASGGGVFSRDAQTVMSYLSGWLGTLCYGKYAIAMLGRQRFDRFTEDILLDSWKIYHTTSRGRSTVAV